MDETRMEQKISFGVTARLLIISVVPAIVIMIALLLITITSMKTGMEEEVLKGLLSAAYTYCDDGLLNIDREKGDNKIENHLKERTGYDFTWFEGERRKNSSLGSEVIGTAASEEVIAQVIGKKQIYTSTKTEVAGQDYFVAYVPVMDSEGKVIAMAFTGVSRESVESKIGESIIKNIFSSTIILLIVIGVVLPVAITMSGATKAIGESMEKMSDGEFEKSDKDKYLKRSDEIGNALRSTIKVVEKIVHVVKKIRNISEHIGLKSSELANTSNDISGVAEGVAQSVMQITEGATEQAGTIQNVTENVVNLSEAIRNVANYSEQLAVTADEMNQAGKTSAIAINNLSNEMTGMQESVKAVTAKMSDTNNAIQMLEKKTANISRIADQTNLLALNASIEAARAGDAGKGFTVVAEEVGKLAGEAKITVDEIKKEMTNLLSQFKEAIAESDEIAVICKDVIGVLNDTEGKINKLIENVEITVEGVTTISALTEECEASKAIIVDDMASLSAFSQQNAATTQETAAAMQEVNSSVSLLAEYAKDLNEIAQELNGEVRFFKI